MTTHTTLVSPEPSGAVNVRLPVLPWVRKVLLKEFGPEPIPVHGHSIFGKHMEALPFDVPEQEENQALQVCGSYIVVRVSSLVWRSVRNYQHLFKAGFFYEKMIQRMMIAHIVAQERLGVANMTALKDWYDMYQLDIDDDYSLDAAYWLWKSYKAGRAGR